MYYSSTYGHTLIPSEDPTCYGVYSLTEEVITVQDILASEREFTD